MFESGSVGVGGGGLLMHLNCNVNVESFSMHVKTIKMYMQPGPGLHTKAYISTPFLPSSEMYCTLNIFFNYWRIEEIFYFIRETIATNKMPPLCQELKYVWKNYF